jgi:hypothetical protein
VRLHSPRVHVKPALGGHGPLGRGNLASRRRRSGERTRPACRGRRLAPCASSSSSSSCSCSYSCSCPRSRLSIAREVGRAPRRPRPVPRPADTGQHSGIATPGHGRSTGSFRRASRPTGQAGRLRSPIGKTRAGASPLHPAEDHLRSQTRTRATHRTGGQEIRDPEFQSSEAQRPEHTQNGDTTTRNPKPEFRRYGKYLPRSAQRTPLRTKYHEPPRNTRRASPSNVSSTWRS